MKHASAVEAGRRPPHRLSGIEASRGVAAGLVVLYHVARHLDKGPGAPTLRSLLQFGHAGVDFFFVISGFIILFVHYGDIGRPDRLAHYVARRFTRLMPTYWVALTLAVAFALAGTHGAPSLANLIWSASLLPSNRETILGVAWTLQFEILFYSLFAVLILSRTAGIVVLILWLSATVLAVTAGLTINWLPPQFLGAYNLEFFFGMAVAVLLRKRPVFHPRPILAVGLILFSMAAILEDFHFLNGYADIARVAYGVPGALLVLGIAASDWLSPVRLAPVARRTGAASYSIYLFQFIFIGAVWQAAIATGLDRQMPVIVLFLILTAAAIGGGIFMSEWVEYPLMKAVRAGMARFGSSRPAADRCAPTDAGKGSK
jgi:peptidoglycan/LPS O-acetylase OafA/YrhL